MKRKCGRQSFYIKHYQKAMHIHATLPIVQFTFYHVVQHQCSLRHKPSSGFLGLILNLPIPVTCFSQFYWGSCIKFGILYIYTSLYFSKNTEQICFFHRKICISYAIPCIYDSIYEFPLS